MKKTLVTMAIVIVISLLCASDFYIGCQSGLSPRGTYWTDCADTLFSLIKHAVFNNTMTDIISLSERNHVSIKSCKRDEIIGIHPIPANVQIPKEMGRSLWSYEKIVSLLE